MTTPIQQYNWMNNYLFNSYWNPGWLNPGWLNPGWLNPGKGTQTPSTYTATMPFNYNNYGATSWMNYPYIPQTATTSSTTSMTTNPSSDSQTTTSQQTSDNENSAESIAERYRARRKERQKTDKNVDKVSEDAKKAAKLANGHCTDGEDDGKIGFGEATLEAAKGAVKSITSCFTDKDGNFSWKKTLITVGATAAIIGACAIPGIGPFIASALPYVGIGLGAINAGKGIKMLCENEKGDGADKRTREAFQEIGAGVFQIATSVYGLKKIKVAKKAIKDTDINYAYNNGIGIKTGKNTSIVDSEKALIGKLNGKYIGTEGNLLNTENYAAQLGSASATDKVNLLNHVTKHSSELKLTSDDLIQLRGMLGSYNKADIVAGQAGADISSKVVGFFNEAGRARLNYTALSNKMVSGTESAPADIAALTELDNVPFKALNIDLKPLKGLNPFAASKSLSGSPATATGSLTLGSTFATTIMSNPLAFDSKLPEILTSEQQREFAKWARQAQRTAGSTKLSEEELKQLLQRYIAYVDKNTPKDTKKAIKEQFKTAGITV